VSALPNEAKAVAEIAAAFARAGLTVSAADVAALVAPYEFVRAGLDALNALLANGAEPAAAFDPRPARSER
jgi:hypothetical protein